MEAATTVLSNLDDDYGEEPFVTPMSASKERKLKRHPSTSDQPQQQQPKQTRIAINFTKIFIVTENVKDNLTYAQFNKLVSGNPHHTNITHLKRAADNSGYILTFQSSEAADSFRKAAFNNELDGAQIRDTKKKTQSIKTDILIHNVDYNISTKEIEADIESHYNIAIHSTYRLQRTSQYEPFQKYDTKTVKITIYTSDEKLFNETITLFNYNKHRISKPTPPPQITQCYNCFNFGHTRQQCAQRARTCIRCGDTHTQPCTQTAPKCSNCGLNHVPTYKNCPAYKQMVNAEKDKIRQQTYAQKAANARTTPRRVNIQTNQPSRQAFLLPTPTPTRTYSYRAQPQPSYAVPRTLPPQPSHRQHVRPAYQQQRGPQQRNVEFLRTPPHTRRDRESFQQPLSATEQIQTIFENIEPNQILPLIQQLMAMLTNMMQQQQQLQHQSQQRQFYQWQ